MKPNKKILPNGLTIITVPMKDNPTVTVLALARVGSAYESKEKNGISHFVEHMLFKGTKRRSSAFQITHELESLGSLSNAYTSDEVTAYHTKGDAKHFKKLLDVIADMYIHSTFPEGEIEKEKGVIIEEINMYEDMSDQKADWLFDSLVYGDTAWGRTVIGTKETVRSLTRKDFVAYRDKNYTTGSTVIVVAGGIDTKTAIHEVKHAFKELPVGKASTLKKLIEQQTTPGFLFFPKAIDQTHLVLGVRAFPVTHKDSATLSVIAGILGGGMSSRLFQLLREELGVAYYLRAFPDLSSKHGVLKIQAGVTNDRTDEVIRHVLNECTRLTVEPVPDAELKKVKDFMIGMIKLTLESSDSFADFFGTQEILKGKVETLKEREKRIRAVTKEDVLRVAKKLFVNKGLNCSLVGPQRKTEMLKKSITF